MLLMLTPLFVALLSATHDAPGEPDAATLTFCLELSTAGGLSGAERQRLERDLLALFVRAGVRAFAGDDRTCQEPGRADLVVVRVELIRGGENLHLSLARRDEPAGAPSFVTSEPLATAPGPKSEELVGRFVRSDSVVPDEAPAAEPATTVTTTPETLPNPTTRRRPLLWTGLGSLVLGGVANGLGAVERGEARAAKRAHASLRSDTPTAVRDRAWRKYATLQNRSSALHLTAYALYGAGAGLIAWWWLFPAVEASVTALPANGGGLVNVSLTF